MQRTQWARQEPLLHHGEPSICQARAQKQPLLDPLKGHTKRGTRPKSGFFPNKARSGLLSSLPAWQRVDPNREKSSIHSFTKIPQVLSAHQARIWADTPLLLAWQGRKHGPGAGHARRRGCWHLAAGEASTRVLHAPLAQGSQCPSKRQYGVGQAGRERAWSHLEIASCRRSHGGKEQAPPPLFSLFLS